MQHSWCVGRTILVSCAFRLNQFSSLFPSLRCQLQTVCFVSTSFPIIVLLSISILCCAICTQFFFPFHFNLCFSRALAFAVSSMMVHFINGVQLRGINLFTFLLSNPMEIFFHPKTEERSHYANTVGGLGIGFIESQFVLLQKLQLLFLSGE